MSDGYSQLGVIAPRPRRDFIGPQSETALGLAIALFTGGTSSASAAYPAANLAIFYPFDVTTAYTVVKGFWQNGTAVAGNVDLGIYTPSGTRVASVGTTAQATVSAMQEVALSVKLQPGSYYLGIAADTGGATQTMIQTAAVATASLWRAAGVYQMATAFPLPSTATFAVYAQTTVPYFGLSGRTLTT